MTNNITALDIFCGAGGSSTGIVDAGVQVLSAVNHWKLAIETHQTNHPNTDHDCVDIRTIHPSVYPRTTFLWASPECTSHSLAKGRKRKSLNQMSLFGDNQIDPSEERSRATMREVYEFAAHHKNEFIIVENVVDIRYWQHYEGWLTDMLNLGYEHQTLYLNAQFFGVPQSRDRFYCVFWRKGNKRPNLDYRPHAYCPHCEKQIEAVQAWKKADHWGRYGKRRQYVYVCPHCTFEVSPSTMPAATVIDWSLPAERIGDRKRPLKPKTIERIKAGLRKFAYEPVVVDTAYSNGERVTSVEDSLPTQTTRQTLGLVQPFILGRDATQSTERPLATIPAGGNNHGLLVPPFMVILKNSYSKDGQYTLPPREMDEPLTTIVASASQHGLVIPPFIVPMRRGSTANSVDEPMHTITAGGRHHALVMSYYGSNAVYAETSEPMPGITTVQRHALIEPEHLLDDCRFRMLEPDELKRGMSFKDSYTILGNKREQVKQIGNAVCPNVARWIVERCVESIA